MGGWGGGKGGKGGKGGCDIKTVAKGLLQAGVFPGTGAKVDAQCLYIKGLPSDTTDLDLYKIFAPFGPIPPQGVKAMTKEDGTCSGIGFVDYVEPQFAEKAISTLNGTMLPDGTMLNVAQKNSSKGKGAGKS